MNQKRLNKRRFATQCIAACALLMCGGATFSQQGWPDKPIRLVVPFTAGGGTDAISRQIAEKIATETKWIVVVDNKPGAGGNIGLDNVAKAKADGYTIGMGQTSTMAINPAALAKMSFDPSRDLVPVALVAEVPTILVVRADASWKTLADMVTAGKTKELRQALASTGTVGHLAGEMLGRKAGFQMLVVPYKGAAPAITDLLGGQTDAMFATPQAVIGMIKGGRLRALAVTSAKRLTILPDVPTIAESGYPGFEAVDWKMIVAPAGTPVEILKRLNAAVEKALVQPAMVKQLADEGSSPMGGSLEKAAMYLKSEQAEWAAVVKAAGIKFD